VRVAGSQNIDFQTTILSRFDMIFIVKDEHNEDRDRVCPSTRQKR
jgi:DNA replicative helicase MCM subunit Mcm2 (Cdc46/Mcm family)